MASCCPAICKIWSGTDRDVLMNVDALRKIAGRTLIDPVGQSLAGPHLLPLIEPPEALGRLR
eukprot:5191996-Lingulodinium_polyedra.AAC.1